MDAVLPRPQLARKGVVTSAAKLVTFKEEARKKLVNGINAVSNAVKVFYELNRYSSKQMTNRPSR